MTLSVQFTTMAVMVLSGIYLGLAQDTFRRFSVHWKNRTVISYLLEIGFWLLQTIIVFYFLFLVNSGEIRLYIFLACLLGFSFYQALLKTVYRNVLEGVISVLRTIFRFIKQVFLIFIVTPLKWIFFLLSGIIVFIINLVVKLLAIILKIILFPFLMIGRILKPLIPENFIKFFHKLHPIYSTIRNILKKGLEYATFKRR
ncbi:spore cortex biosynthesis protein YabQ [Oceanobacillus alkalisoli]|uniref:spore cortex biosynthesis protein YabQ n=1 Tax=Oceanobacillus alkalisoli TaxID=2925113 RepID=UPI001F11D5B9|nr:spore cortex biosynthesis protein YabQ [Oceanobacillus alkalisoli]MCF3944461.1 spore cortex biosynthesis protein YabQ [Oceanobacillus alkalisoli]